jgi:hypothetical protein
MSFSISSDIADSTRTAAFEYCVTFFMESTPIGNIVNMLISPIARMKIARPISISVKPDWD